MEFSHVSVLLEESIDALGIKKDGIYIDATCGGGGHSFWIAKGLRDGRLICIDKDKEALEASRHRLKDFDFVSFLHSDFKALRRLLLEEKISKVDGILIDLGVSSYQLDNKKRGFSYMADEYLDMRMDRESKLMAADILNNYEKDELIRIFRDFGEEKYARKIAEAIVRDRNIKKIETAGQLNKIIEENVPKNMPGGHPSKRVFQALRIEVNEELEGLYEFLIDAISLLNDRGRLCVISFHSLEDTIVKKAFKKAQNPCECPPNFPVCVCKKESLGKIITRKPICPTDREININKRSQSAKLRVFERIES